jgi:hypothetical protein
MLLNARRARRAATVFLTAAFGVPVFAADSVIGTWMSGAGPSAKTYVFKTHDNTFIGTVCGPCDDPSTVFGVADGTVTDAGHVSFVIVGGDGPAAATTVLTRVDGDGSLVATVKSVARAPDTAARRPLGRGGPRRAAERDAEARRQYGLGGRVTNLGACAALVRVGRQASARQKG